MLTDERKEEITKIIDEIQEIDNALRPKLVKKSTTENWAIVLMYESSARLLKHSKALNRWTVVIAVFTVVLGLSTIWSIIDKFLL